MKIIIPGGSGQMGTLLARHFASEGHEIVVLSRNPTTTPWRTVDWDAQTLGSWVSELESADLVINMAGRSVNCRYGKRNRKAILDSRVNSTRVVGEAIAKCNRPPALWLQASTATIYSHRYNSSNDEEHGILGGGEPGVPTTWRFSIDVAKAWEEAMDSVPTPHTRKVKLRSAMTMSADRGGVFDVLLRLVRLRLGGRAGDGRQYVSWIHGDDFIRAIEFIIAHPELDGPVNLASPYPLPNVDFMRELREAWGVSIGLPASRWMLELGAFLLRTETELILKSRRVIPRRLVDLGFEFKFNTWAEASRDLCLQRRRESTRPRR